jgi:hypothetical protein
MFGEHLINVSLYHPDVRQATYLSPTELLTPSLSLPPFALHLVDEWCWTEKRVARQARTT